MFSSFNTFYSSKKAIKPNNLKNMLKKEKVEPVLVEKFSISDRVNMPVLNESIELALLTVNLSWNRFKSFSKEDLDLYVKSVAYNSGENRKYLLALKILNDELNKYCNPVIKQSIQNQKSNMTDTNIYTTNPICVEPDEFKLNILSCNNQNMNNSCNKMLNSVQSVPMNNSFNQQNMRNDNMSRMSMGNGSGKRNLDIGCGTNYISI